MIYGLAVGLVCSPFVSAFLLGLHRAGRALRQLARKDT